MQTKTGLPTQLEIENDGAGLFFGCTAVKFQLAGFGNCNTPDIGIGGGGAAWVYHCLYHVAAAVDGNIHRYFCILIKFIGKRRKVRKSPAAETTSNADATFAGAAIAGIAVRCRVAIGFALVAVATRNALVAHAIVRVAAIATGSIAVVAPPLYTAFGAGGLGVAAATTGLCVVLLVLGNSAVGVGFFTGLGEV